MAAQFGGTIAPRRVRPRRSVELLRRQLTPRRIVFALVLLAYVALTVVVIAGWTPVDSLDRKIDLLHLRNRSPGAKHFFLDYVMMGQRGPSTLAMLPIFAFICWKRHSLRPCVQLVVALAVLNLSVGAVKVATGRWGPLATSRAHDVFAGGDIFPSGHTANAVVLYGVLAIVVSRHWRVPVIIAATWISLTVGLSTLYLDTHWLTDVLGGWLAGGLVLLALPRCEQITMRCYAMVRSRLDERRAARRSQEADPGEVLRALPEILREDVVTRCTAGADVTRVPPRLGDPARAVEGTADGVRRRRREEGGQRTHVGALRDEPVGQTHD
jgi:membrane-associated phospholipid phosphatase